MLKKCCVLLFALIIFAQNAHGILFSNPDDGVNEYILKNDIFEIPSLIVTPYFMNVTHELGHAVAAVLFGGTIKSLKLYPHTYKGVFILAGIEAKMNSKFTVPIFAVAGVAAVYASAYYLAQELPNISNISLRNLVNFYVFHSIMHFPMYAFFDIFNHWGDIALIADYAGIPKWFQLFVSLASSYYLYQTYEKYFNMRPNDGVIESIRSKANGAVTNVSVKLPLEFNISDTSKAIPTALYNPITKSFGGGIYINF